MLSMSLPFNLILLVVYFNKLLKANLKELSFTSISINLWIISAIILYSIYYGNLLRMKLAYIAFLPLAIILFPFSNKIKKKLGV